MSVRTGVLLRSSLAWLFLADLVAAWEGFIQWERVPPPLYGGFITTIATDPTDKDVIYAGTYGGGLFKSEDGGRTWVHRTVRTDLTEESIYQMAVDPQDPRCIFAVASDGVFISSDAGDTWRDITPKGRISPLPNSMLLLEGEPKGILLSIENRGIFRSEDKGASWEHVYSSFRRTGGLTVNPLRTG